MADCQAHNLKAGGSSPSFATTLDAFRSYIEEISKHCKERTPLDS